MRCSGRRRGRTLSRSHPERRRGGAQFEGATFRISSKRSNEFPRRWACRRTAATTARQLKRPRRLSRYGSPKAGAERRSASGGARVGAHVTSNRRYLRGPRARDAPTQPQSRRRTSTTASFWAASRHPTTHRTTRRLHRRARASRRRTQRVHTTQTSTSTSTAAKRRTRRVESPMRATLRAAGRLRIGKKACSTRSRASESSSVCGD
mmetsp:Transcript_38837/g.89515  ORF Transcript_38837/g.89515 Transcript_38837/m.89515 type:complete len:207 (+) Transcript_38837:820-1440(+)